MTDLKAFQTLLKSTKESVIVLFSADFCGPCQRLKPLFKKLGSTAVNSIFIIVDVSDNDDIASEYKINRIPEIKVFKEEKQIDGMMGANEESFKKLIDKYA